MEEETVQVFFSFSHPLFSCFITLYTLFLIYFPNDLLRLFLSPVLLISAALLFSLLRLGSTRESNTPPGNSYKVIEEKEESNVLVCDSDTMCNFVEWNLRAPLEVIHEAYEEDDEDEEENQSIACENDPTRFRELERFPSLSLCYPESDSESDSETSSEFNFPEIGEWDSPEKFRWEDDIIGSQGLIEIKLDHSCNKLMRKPNQTEIDFHAEEDGLIEIDLFPMNTMMSAPFNFP